MEYVIEKNVPIPDNSKVFKHSFSHAVRRMEVGDSIFSELSTSDKIACVVLGKGNYISRKEGKGRRIWRIK